MAFAEARELIRQRMFQQAKAELEPLLRAADHPPAERAAAFRLAAAVHCRLGDPYAARNCAETALHLAGQVARADLVAEAHFALGITLTELGDAPAALDHLHAFMDRRQDSPQGARWEPKALLAIARNLDRRRQYADAIATYRQAADLFAERGPEWQLPRCWRHLIDCLLMLDRPAAALPYIRQLAEYTGRHPEDHCTANALLVDRAHYHRTLGDCSTSMRYCQELFRRTTLQAEHRTEGAWLAGLNLADLGDLDGARRCAGQALEYGMQARWPLAVNRANALRRRIADAEARLLE